MNKKLCGMFCCLFLPSALRASSPAWPVTSRAPGALCTFDFILFYLMVSTVITTTCASNPAFAYCFPGLLNASALSAEVAAAISDLCSSCPSRTHHHLVSSIRVREIPSEAIPQAPFPRKAAQPCHPRCSRDPIRCHSNSSASIV